MVSIRTAFPLRNPLRVHCLGVGTPAWTRTKDQLIKSQLLYQLSYRGISHGTGGWGLNHQPLATGGTLKRKRTEGNRKIPIRLIFSRFSWTSGGFGRKQVVCNGVVS
jgi:hypothetical protein